MLWIGDGTSTLYHVVFVFSDTLIDCVAVPCPSCVCACVRLSFAAESGPCLIFQTSKEAVSL